MNNYPEEIKKLFLLALIQKCKTEFKGQNKELDNTIDGIETLLEDQTIKFYDSVEQIYLAANLKPPNGIDMANKRKHEEILANFCPQLKKPALQKSQSASAIITSSKNNSPIVARPNLEGNHKEQLNNWIASLINAAETDERNYKNVTKSNDKLTPDLDSKMIKFIIWLNDNNLKSVVGDWHKKNLSNMQALKNQVNAAMTQSRNNPTDTNMKTVKNIMSEFIKFCNQSKMALTIQASLDDESHNYKK